MKKRFDRDIGPGAYRRYEGHDVTTNSDYYIVVGPTVEPDIGKCFFAGIKKLPRDKKKKVYSPDGEYFTNIASAYSHASNKWGVTFPAGQTNYTKQQLENVDVPEHIKG